MAAIVAPTAPAPAGPSRVDRPHRRRVARPPIGLTLVSVAVALVFASPILYIAWRNITTGSDVLEELTSANTLEPLGRSVALALAVSLSAAAIGTALAWVVARTDVPGRRLWRLLAPLPLVYPSYVGAAALITAFASEGLVDRALEPFGVESLPTFHGFGGSWLVLVLFTYPLVYLPVAARLRSLPPSLEESAQLLGRSRFAIFRTVVLPQSAGAIGAGALLVFLYTLSEFGVVQLMRYDTLTRAIYANRLLDPARSFALAFVLGLVAITVVVTERLVVRRRMQTEATGAKRAAQVPLGRWRWPVGALVGIFIANALVGPAAALGWWAGRGLLRAEDAGQTLATDLGGLAAPAWNSAMVSVVPAAVAVAVVLPLAYLTTRFRSRVGGVANAFVVGGYALPGISIALAVVFWAINAPGGMVVYQTLPLLIFAYVIHFGAQSMRASQVAVSGVPTRLDDAARMLGAGRARRFFTVDLPLMVPGLLAGGGLVLLSVMKELPTTLLLSPIGFETLATRIWNALEDGFLAEVGLTSLVLVAVSGVLTWLLVVRRADRFA